MKIIHRIRFCQQQEIKKEIERDIQRQVQNMLGR